MTRLEDALFNEDNKPSLEELLKQGQQQLDNEFYERAIKTYSDAVRTDKNSARAWAGLGDAYRGESILNYNECKEAYENAISLDQNNEQAWLGYGLNELDGRIIEDGETESVRGGDTEKGFRALQKTVKINPRNHKAWYIKGCKELLYPDKVNEGLQSLEKAHQINRYDKNVVEKLMVFSKTDDQKKMWANRLLGLDKHNSQAHTTLGFYYMKQHSYLMAKKMFEEGGNHEWAQRMRDYHGV